LIYYYFFWNLLSILGYQPQLYFCVLCQKKLKPEKLYFSPSEGGIICQNCAKKVKDIKEIKPELVKILRKIIEGDWKTLLKLKNIEKYFKSLEMVSENYFSFLFEKKNDIIEI
jgi:DNA repair protein RecO (recombination protein O)